MTQINLPSGTVGPAVILIQINASRASRPQPTTYTGSINGPARRRFADLIYRSSINSLWRRHRTWLLVAVAAVVLAILGTNNSARSDWTEQEATRDTMQVIFDSLHYLFQIDLAGGSFDSPQNREQVLVALRELDDQSAILASHGFSEDASGLFLASVLERYSLLMLRSFEQGETERVQELLYGLTDVCIACHTRLPSTHDSPVAKQFVDSRTIASLPAERKARLQVATRRFDDALVTLEAMLESGNPGDLAVLEQAIRTYLAVNIRVKGDMERPIPILESIEERSAPNSAWQRDVGAWVQSLQHYRDKPFIVDPLRSARASIDAAAELGPSRQRGALVDYLAASSLLHRYLVSGPEDVMAISEAHYLLGLAEYRIHEDDWLPQAELYLEVAIVLAPHAPWAEDAYALLVEKIRRTYMDVPDGQLPPDVVERLIELRQAIDGGKPSKATASLSARDGIPG